MRVGKRAAFRRRSWRALWKMRSTSSTLRWRGCAARKCRCPIRNISRMRRSRRCRVSSPQRAGWSRAMSEFRMPSLGADMEFGTLVDWRVKEGDAVKRGDVIALVETEKGVIEVEIFESGVIESLVVRPGDKVPVGTTLALVRGDGKSAPVQPTPASIAATPMVEKPRIEQKR